MTTAPVAVVGCGSSGGGTLIADARTGNRPSFTDAARPEAAEPIYEAFCRALEREGVRVVRGIFGARMEVALVNDGPVTIVLDVGASGERS